MRCSGPACGGPLIFIVRLHDPDLGGHIGDYRAVASIAFGESHGEAYLDRHAHGRRLLGRIDLAARSGPSFTRRAAPPDALSQRPGMVVLKVLGIGMFSLRAVGRGEAAPFLVAFKMVAARAFSATPWRCVRP